MVQVPKVYEKAKRVAVSLKQRLRNGDTGRVPHYKPSDGKRYG